MTTSSARPDALDEAARGFASSGTRLHDAARALWSAADAYALHCSDAPLDLTSPSRVGAAVADGRDVVHDLREVAAAFRVADRSPVSRTTPPLDHVVRVTDVGLSWTIVARHPGLGAELTGPTRALQRRGTDLAARMARAMASGGAAAAVALLDDVRPADRLDPLFAASVCNGLGSDRIRSITEELAPAAADWTIRLGPLADFARLWTTATRSLDLPPRAERLDADLLSSLLATTSGRNVLRALTGTSDRPSGTRYLAQVIGPLLTRPARLDASLSPVYLLLRGAGREGDPDAPMIGALARVPDLAVDFFLHHPIGSTRSTDLEARTTALLSLPGAQVAAAGLLGQVLRHERFSADDHSRDRTAVLRATHAWVVDRGPRRVAEPMAQFLADSVATDIDFYLGRVDEAPGGSLQTVLQAVTAHERPWMTALLAFEYHGVRLTRDALHGSTDERVGALHGIGRLEDHFEAAAEETDRPVDHSSGVFGLLDAVAGFALDAAKLHPVAGLVAGHMVDEGMDAWQRSTLPEPGDHAARTRLAREGLRRRIWVVIASDQAFGAELDWSVGGTSADRHQHLGSTIGGIDDLLALRGSDEDLDELAGWAEGQPDHLRAMVDTYLVGAGQD